MTARVNLNHILFDFATRMIPAAFATVMFAAGTLLLLSILTPIAPAVMPMVQKWLPLVLVDYVADAILRPARMGLAALGIPKSQAIRASDLVA